MNLKTMMITFAPCSQVRVGGWGSPVSSHWSRSDERARMWTREPPAMRTTGARNVKQIFKLLKKC